MVLDDADLALVQRGHDGIVGLLPLSRRNEGHHVGGLGMGRRRPGNDARVWEEWGLGKLVTGRMAVMGQAWWAGLTGRAQAGQRRRERAACEARKVQPMFTEAAGTHTSGGEKGKRDRSNAVTASRLTAAPASGPVRAFRAYCGVRRAAPAADSSYDRLSQQLRFFQSNDEAAWSICAC